MVLTAGKLRKHFEESGVNPKLIKHLHGRGWFDRVIGAVKKGAEWIKNNPETVAQVGKAGLDIYKTIKGGKITAGNMPSGGAMRSSMFSPGMRNNSYDKMYEKPIGIDSRDYYKKNDWEQYKGGSMEDSEEDEPMRDGAGIRGVKHKRKPSHRAIKMGVYMKSGMSMAQASARYKKEHPK